MEVWVLEWVYPSDADTNVTIWNDKVSAQKQAVKEIQDIMVNDWDMDNIHCSSCADDFDDMISRGDYDGAIRRFNEYQDDHNSDYAQYYRVYSRNVLGDSTSTVNHSHSHSSQNGATCRGPCKQYNDYANSDRADGTYVCRQCKTFGQIFGNSP